MIYYSDLLIEPATAIYQAPVTVGNNPVELPHERGLGRPAMEPSLRDRGTALNQGPGPVPIHALIDPPLIRLHIFSFFFNDVFAGARAVFQERRGLESGHLFFQFSFISLDFREGYAERPPDLGAFQSTLLYQSVDGPDRDGEVLGHLVHAKILFEGSGLHSAIIHINSGARFLRQRSP